MPLRLNEISGIDEPTLAQLSKANIKTTRDLLVLCSDKKGREAISQFTGCHEPELLKWANIFDLMRIPGVGEEFSVLLEASGIRSLAMLRRMDAAFLAARVRKVNVNHQLTLHTPSETMIKKWIAHAKSLESLMT